MTTSIPGHVLADSAPDLQQSDAPISSLHLYRRLFQGRKHLFAPSDTSSADYFIENPVPHKHHGSWKPVFYRGDNPKYTPTATVIGRAFRTAIWSSFRLWLGDGVREVLENEARAKAKRKAARKAKCRMVFGLKPKPPKEPLEDEKEVLGKVVVVEMRRGGLFTRKFDWEVDGEQYRWSGTRMFSTGPMKGVKGWTHDLKLVRKSDNAVIATFEKGRWASYSKSIRSDGPPNKKKLLIGKLQMSSPSATSNVAAPLSKTGHLTLSNIQGRIDDAFSRTPEIDEQDLNLHGTHAGNLTADAIALSCWIVVEAEHRLRYKVLDLFEEIGESAGG
ncbi:hypothetical protein N7444_002035 [Penicillium canescens]|nr:hypothetical protein N7444_002035 [Penicillium canescens]